MERGSGNGAEPAAGGKLSWSELKGVVSDLRRQLSSLSTMVPSSVSFRTLQDGRTRIYFLSTPQNGWETTLIYADVPAGEHTPGQRLQWQSVIEANFPSLSTGNKFSREELLLWERKRLATWGITSYELHSASGKLVFPAASSLFQCTDTGFSVILLLSIIPNSTIFRLILMTDDFFVSVKVKYGLFQNKTK